MRAPPKRPLLKGPRSPITQRADSEAIVQALIAAAIELGPQANLAAIAERAGVGMASLHRYFPTAASIFAEISRRSYRMLLEQIRALTARPGLDLRAMIEQICGAALDGPGLSAEHRQRLNTEIPLGWSLETVEPVYREVLAELLRWTRAHMTEPPADLEARIFIAFGLVRGVVLMSLLFPALAPPTDQILPMVVDAVHGTLVGPGSVDAGEGRS